MKISKKFSSLIALCGIILGGAIFFGGCEQTKSKTTKPQKKSGQVASPEPKIETEETTITLPGGVPLVLMRIPKGTFMMGSPDDEQDRSSREGPQHEVTLTKDFYMGKYEVTKAQWTAIMGNEPWSEQKDVLNDPNSPAVNVSWNDINGADGFLEKINEHLGTMGQPYRLPSEAEWEYACRGSVDGKTNGKITRFYWGDDPNYTLINDYAWFRGNVWDPNEEYAHIVGRKTPNAWGLHDMSGNVAEWCQDKRYSNYTDAPNDGTAWEDGTSTTRVLRGGGWNYSSRYCRSAFRSYLKPDIRSYNLGFRVVRTQD